MAALLYHWALDDGSGAVADDPVGGNDGQLIGSYSTPPTWIASGDDAYGTALRFNGEAFQQNGTQRVYTPDPTGTDCSPRLGDNGWSMVLAFRGLAAISRPVFTLINGTWVPGATEDPLVLFGFYIGMDQKLHFGVQQNSGSQIKVSCASDSAVVDSQWHFAVATVTPHQSGLTQGVVKLWIDNVLQASTPYTLPGYNLADHEGCKVMLGMGRLNNVGTSVFFPSSDGSNGLGTFNGDIGFARLYCGPLTDEEVAALYYAYNPRPPTIAGHCPSAADILLCRPSATARVGRGSTTITTCRGSSVMRARVALAEEPPPPPPADPAGFVSSSYGGGYTNQLNILMYYPPNLTAGNTVLAIAFGHAGSWAYPDLWRNDYITAPTGWTQLLDPSAQRAQWDRFASQDLVAGVWAREIPPEGLSGTQTFACDFTAIGVQNRGYWVMLQLSDVQWSAGVPALTIVRDQGETGTYWVTGYPPTDVEPLRWSASSAAAAGLDILVGCIVLGIGADQYQEPSEPAGYTSLLGTLPLEPEGAFYHLFAGHKSAAAGALPAVDLGNLYTPATPNPLGAWIALRIVA